MGPGYHAGSCPGAALNGVLFGDPATVSARLEALKTTLAITDNQQAAWNAFADSAKKQAENRQALFEKMHSGQAARNTPEWLTQHSEAMKQRDADMTSVSSSFKKLYDVLTPAQRTAIDEGQVALGPRYGWRGR
jgi:hypothetical protein